MRNNSSKFKQHYTQSKVEKKTYLHILLILRHKAIALTADLASSVHEKEWRRDMWHLTRVDLQGYFELVN